jgi:hypothetical protein
MIPALAETQRILPAIWHSVAGCEAHYELA